MTSTAIVTEILVVGFQAAVWLGLLFLLIADLKGSNPEAIVRAAISLKEWAALITIFVIGLAYAIGIIVDRVADSVLSYFEKKIISKDKRRNDAIDDLKKEGFDVNLPEAVGLMRMYVMAKSPEMTKFLEYIRSRMRIARSTTFNIVPMTVTAVLLARHPNHLWPLILLVGLALLAISTYVSLRISESYYSRLSEAYGIIQNDKPAE